MSNAKAAQVGQRAPQYVRVSVENARPHLLQIAPCRVRLTEPRAAVPHRGTYDRVVVSAVMGCHV